MGNHRTWGTVQELAFIDRLGTGCFRDGVQAASRAEALRGYIRGLHRRKRWGGAKHMSALLITGLKSSL